MAKAQKSTSARLMADGGLADSHDDVSVTARDAMIACKEFGDRYLWMNVLCIMQDNTDDHE